MGPSADALLDSTVAASPLAGKYATATDRESAFEMLAKADAAQAAAAQQQQAAPPQAAAPAPGARLPP